MRCPFCNADKERLKVIDSRTCEGGRAIRRRRECNDCTKRFTTYERIEQPIRLMVVKKDGRRVPWDKAKVLNNGLFSAQLGLIRDALAAGQELGLDRARLVEVLRAGSARSFTVDVAAGMPDGPPPEMMVSLLAKDGRILADVIAGRDFGSLLQSVVDAFLKPA